MSQIDDVIQGLQIIKECEDFPCVQAEHDAIYAGDPSKTPADKSKKLSELNWSDEGNGVWVRYI